MISYDILKNIFDFGMYKYDKREATKLLIKISRSLQKDKGDMYKIELFRMMNVIIIDNIRRFLFKYKHTGERTFEVDDLINEFYIVFEKCVNDFKWYPYVKLYPYDKRKPVYVQVRSDTIGRWRGVGDGKYYKDKDVKQNSNFLFFYNKSLIRATKRLYEKYCEKYKNQICSDDWHQHLHGHNLGTSMVEFDILNMSLNSDEVNLVNSRLEGVEVNAFIRDNKLDNNTYYKKLSNIRKIVKDEYCEN